MGFPLNLFFAWADAAAKDPKAIKTTKVVLKRFMNAV
jgi:hypothetical protein